MLHVLAVRQFQMDAEAAHLPDGAAGDGAHPRHRLTAVLFIHLNGQFRRLPGIRGAVKAKRQMFVHLCGQTSHTVDDVPLLIGHIPEQERHCGAFRQIQNRWKFIK